VYRSVHIELLQQKKDWFESMKEAHTVCWWIPAGTRPSVADGMAKLDELRKNGSSENAFTFAKPFPMPTKPS